MAEYHAETVLLHTTVAVCQSCGAYVSDSDKHDYMHYLLDNIGRLLLAIGKETVSVTEREVSAHASANGNGAATNRT
jgi:hypothetical protein